MATTKKTTAVAIKKNTAVSKKADEEVLARNAAAFPSEDKRTYKTFPRLRMVSKDKLEGTGKSTKVVIEAGTFFTEVQDEEETEVEEEVRQKNGKVKTETVKKRLWNSTELGAEVEGIIIYQRYQLKMWDQKNERFVSSAIYDKGDIDIPLFEGGNEIARGTPAELKEPYNYVEKGKDGKKDYTTSKLKDERVLFVWLNNGVYQMSVKGKSMYNYLKYTGTVEIPNVVTEFNSVPDAYGSNNFNTMTFTKVRDVTAKEAELISEAQDVITAFVQEQKSAFANKQATADEGQNNLEEF